ncbi:MAG: hypothetical protein LBO72_11185 [Helicobacteraceae bacterium]|jgi:hypothetical protein|nr:hypothetical protein [Helicobacteraceae bacterium]
MQSVLKAALCVGVAAQILSAGETLVESESLDGYTKYAIFSFYGKRGAGDEAIEPSQAEQQSAPVGEEAQSDAGLEPLDATEEASASENETLALEEEGANEEAIDAEPKTSSDGEAGAEQTQAPAEGGATQPAAQTPAGGGSQFYGADSEEEDCGDYCK